MSTVSSAALDDLHRRIGRNLLRFQQIEFALKFALPYMHPDGGKAGFEALKKYRERIGSKPLGEVVQALEESIDIPDGFFSRKLKDVVDARNAFVHHFFELPGIDLMSPTGLAELTRYLDQQYESAAELFEFARVLSGAALLAVLDSRPGAYPELEAMRATLEASLPEVTWVKDESPSGA